MKRTARFWAFLAASFVFWFFANQTQIGWLYVVSAVLAGVLLAAWFFNRGSLKAIEGQREILQRQETWHEGDEIHFRLNLKNQGSIPASSLALVETCPLAPPESPEAELRMFIPTLYDSLAFDYQTIIHRRGLHQFPAIKISSRAPFGFFQREGELAIGTTILAYPELKKLRSFSLLDKQPAAELVNPRAGIGTEVIGVRPYRAGDSPRHIHWRSVARRGQLVSKEFAEEIQAGLTIVLDRYCPLDPIPKTKHQPFEIAIKSALSIADYAIRKQYPVYLAADSDGMAYPQGAIVLDSLMQYLAKVPSHPKANLGDVLNYQTMQQFVAVALAWPDESLIETFIRLKQRGINLFVAIPDPVSFPIEADVSAAGMVSSLERAGISAKLLKYGDDWAEILASESRLIE